MSNKIKGPYGWSNNSNASWSTSEVTLEGLLSIMKTFEEQRHDLAQVRLHIQIAELLRSCAMSFEGLVRIGRSVRVMRYIGEFGFLFSNLFRTAFAPMDSRLLGALPLTIDTEFLTRSIPGSTIRSFTVSELLGLIIYLPNHTRTKRNYLPEIVYTEYRNHNGVSIRDSYARVSHMVGNLTSTFDQLTTTAIKDDSAFSKWLASITNSSGLVNSLWNSLRKMQYRFHSGEFAGKLQDAYGDAGDDRMMEVLRLVVINQLYPRRVDMVPAKQITNTFAATYYPRFTNGAVEFQKSHRYLEPGEELTSLIQYRDVYLFQEDRNLQYGW